MDMLVFKPIPEQSDSQCICLPHAIEDVLISVVTMSEPSTPSGRPRRSARAPAKVPAPVAIADSSSSALGKRKLKEAGKDPAEELEHLLTSPRSKLTKMEISDILNYRNFLDLSSDSQNLLVSLLPPTAFSTFTPSIPPTHIDYSQTKTHDTMDVDSPTEDSLPALSPQHHRHSNQECSRATLEPSIFHSSFFLSAARTFQDHLYAGWFGKKAQEDVARFETGVLDGSLHAEWKDEVWERDYRPRENKKAKVLDLTALAKCGLLREGDVLAYHREFPHLRLVVEKDLLIESINPRSHTLTILLPRGSASRLHSSLLVSDHQDPDDNTLEMEDIADPGVLETGILDVDGRVSRADKYVADRGDLNAPLRNGPSVTSSMSNAGGPPITHHAWKSFTVWRWTEETRNAVEMQLLQERGGRERFGSLFYLRVYCHDQS
ncbi:hypothetical protein AcW1_003082 [Taiwanofungus camphoratus]|nr:hypothetical protein AcW1_003082 [Antrodia cinnamomea]